MVYSQGMTMVKGARVAISPPLILSLKIKYSFIVLYFIVINVTALSINSGCSTQSRLESREGDRYHYWLRIGGQGLYAYCTESN